MWECSKCNYKNSNSSLKCHGSNCKGIRTEAKENKEVKTIRKPKPIKRIYDFCPVHKKDVVLIETKWKGKQAWRCTAGSHKPCFLRGKSKPFPPGLLEELERKDLEQITA